jgi:hypothetical protein
MTKTEHKSRTKKATATKKEKTASKAPKPKSLAKAKDKVKQMLNEPLFREVVPKEQRFKKQATVRVELDAGPARVFTCSVVAGVCAGLEAMGLRTDKGVHLRVLSETGSIDSIVFTKGKAIDPKFLTITDFVFVRGAQRASLVKYILGTEESQ